MTDIEVNIDQSKKENQIENHENHYKNDVTMETSDKDPLATDEGDKSDISIEVKEEKEPPVSLTETVQRDSEVIDKGKIVEIQIEKTIIDAQPVLKDNGQSTKDEHEEIQLDNSSIETDSNGLVEALKTDNQNDLLPNSKKEDKTFELQKENTEHLVLKLEPETNEVIQSDVKEIALESVVKEDIKSEPCESASEVILTDNVGSIERNDNVDSSDKTKVDLKIEEVSNEDDKLVTNIGENNSEKNVCPPVSDISDITENKDNIKCENSPVASEHDDESHNYKDTEIQRTKDNSCLEADLVKEKATEDVEVKAMNLEPEIKNYMCETDISVDTKRENVEKDCDINKIVLAPTEDPLRSLTIAMKKHIMEVDEVHNVNDDGAKDLEKELPMTIVSINNENLNNKVDETRSSGESDSDERTLHIVEDNADPSELMGVDLVNNKDKNKSKRKSSDVEKSDVAKNPSKKLCKELQASFEHHDAMITSYLQTMAFSSVEDIDKQAEFLESEIDELKELIQIKETEWNHAIHLKKVKEEILLRLNRRKKVLLLQRVNHDLNERKKLTTNNKKFCHTVAPNVLQERIEESPSMFASHMPMINSFAKQINVNSPSLVTPPSTSPYCPISMPNYSLDKSIHYYGNKKIVPKPVNILPNRPGLDRNGQLENFMMPMGRQGPIKDVQSIIADYRNRHPETVPRRGRRLRSMLNPQTPQMAVGPRPIAPHSDHSVDLGMYLNRMENNPHVSVSEALSSHNPLLQQIPTSLPNGMSFKDVLVQFANLSGNGSGQPGNNGIGSNLPPPPPYPEVTLHPVGNTLSGVKVTPIPPVQMMSSNQHSSNSGQQSNSLLHGILTKQQSKQQESRQDNRFSTFSPTLARLLTAPEKNTSSSSSTTSTAYSPSKNCLEITITPVPNTNQTSSKSEPEVVHLDDYEDPELEEDSAERPLVIDEEGADKDNGAVELNENDVPECQGCHKKEAQFVCAGCANQWYCSRECQVNAWDEHSEMCSG